MRMHAEIQTMHLYSKAGILDMFSTMFDENTLSRLQYILVWA